MAVLKPIPNVFTLWHVRIAHNPQLDETGQFLDQQRSPLLPLESVGLTVVIFVNDCIPYAENAQPISQLRCPREGAAGVSGDDKTKPGERVGIAFALTD